MLDNGWDSAQGVDYDHDTTYQAALMAFEMVRGVVPDPQWRALLYLGTGNRELWTWLTSRLDFQQGHANLDEVAELRGELGSLLTLARHLFHGRPAQVNLADTLQSLGDRNRAVVLGAMAEFCG